MRRHPTEKSPQVDKEAEQNPTEVATRTCDECGERLRDNEAQGEVVCEGCGLVISDSAIDHGPDWRAFSKQEEEKKKRVGAPVTKMKHDKGLSTNISWKDEDAYGKSLSEKQRKKMNRLREWNKRFRSQDAQDRNLKRALTEINRMASALGLNEQVKETTSILYRRCQEKNMIQGRAIESMAAACLYAASRQCRTPRTLNQIYTVSRLYDDSPQNPKMSNRINRAYRFISNQLGLELKPVDPRNYLNRYMNELSHSVDSQQEVTNTAKQILTAGENENVHSGKAPSCLAASAIYASSIICDQKMTQSRIAEATNTSKMTIRTQYKTLLSAYKSD